MKRHDLLLTVGALCLVAAAVLVSVPLGLAVAGVALIAAWFLLGEA